MHFSSPEKRKISQEEFVRIGEQYLRMQSKLKIYLYKWLGCWIGMLLVVYGIIAVRMIDEKVVWGYQSLLLLIPLAILALFARHFHEEKWLSRDVYQAWLDGRIKLKEGVSAGLDDKPINKDSLNNPSTFWERNKIYFKIVLPTSYAFVFLLEVFDILKARLGYIVIIVVIVYNIIKDEAKYKRVRDEAD